MTLSETYQAAAVKANADGVDAGNTEQLTVWIRANCHYREESEFFLVLGIGCELADIQARAAGFKHEVDRAFQLAQKRMLLKEKGETRC